MTPKITVYTKSFCPFCVRAKNLLKNKGLDFEEISVEGNDALYAELKSKTGHLTVPQIFINDQMIGGFTDLDRLNQTGELDALLASVNGPLNPSR